MRKLLMIALAVFFVTPAYAGSKAIDINSPTVLITAAATTDRIALPSGGGDNIMISNDSDKTCFVKGGVVTVTAAVTDVPVLAGTIQLFSKARGVTYIAAICNASVTGTIYISQGPGE